MGKGNEENLCKSGGRALLSPTYSCRIPEDSQDSILANVPANIFSPVVVHS
jgi:hypothetical protein